MKFLIIFFSILSLVQSNNGIWSLSLANIYKQAEEMKFVNFGLLEYRYVQKSKNFDFIKFAPSEDEAKSDGYFAIYYDFNDSIRYVTKFSNSGVREYTIFKDSIDDYSFFMWMVVYNRKNPMINGFFLSIQKKKLFFIGISEPMRSKIEVFNTKGEKDEYDFGYFSSLPSYNIANIDKIAALGYNLQPYNILHFNHGIPVAIEDRIDLELEVLPPQSVNCEENTLEAGNLNFAKINIFLDGAMCHNKRVFKLQPREVESISTLYYSFEQF